MRRQIRNRGFSLVELIVAFAILGTATLGIGSFYVASSRSSTNVNQEADLQNEAQLVTNQMEKMIISVDLGINFKEFNAATDAEEKVLYLFNATDEGTMELFMLKWVKSDQMIYYQNLDAEALKAYTNVSDIPLDGTWELMAEYVQSFSVTLNENNDKVRVQMTFSNGRSDTEIDKTLRLRNTAAINEEELGKIGSKINVALEEKLTGVSINVSPNIVASGLPSNLTKNIKAVGNPSMEETWLLDDSADPHEWAKVVGDKIEITNLDEVDSALHIKLSVTDNDNECTMISNEEIVKILKSLEITLDETSVVRTAFGTENDDTTKIEAYSVMGGLSYHFNATVDGAGFVAGEDDRIVWSLSGAEAVNAEISSEGVLTIDKYSAEGRFDVVATLAKRTDIQVKFPVVIGKGLTENSVLEIRGASTICRGSEEVYKAYLNDVLVDPEDCIWSVSVVEGSSTNFTADAFSVGTTGIVSVKEDLPYTANGKILVSAKLKRDPDIECYSKEVNVESVWVEVKPAETSASRGKFVEIACVVHGMEDYAVNWSFARITSDNRNPADSEYRSADGNTYLTWGTGGESQIATLFVGSDEIADVLGISVKASVYGTELTGTTTISTLAKMQVFLSQNGTELANNSYIDRIEYGKTW